MQKGDFFQETGGFFFRDKGIFSRVGRGRGNIFFYSLKNMHPWIWMMMHFSMSLKAELKDIRTVYLFLFSKESHLVFTKNEFLNTSLVADSVLIKTF